jgi:hypothetical protein
MEGRKAKDKRERLNGTREWLYLLLLGYWEDGEKRKEIL